MTIREVAEALLLQLLRKPGLKLGSPEMTSYPEQKDLGPGSFFLTLQHLSEVQVLTACFSSSVCQLVWAHVPESATGFAQLQRHQEPSFESVLHWSVEFWGHRSNLRVR